MKRGNERKNLDLQLHGGIRDQPKTNIIKYVAWLSLPIPQ